jgi:hypothetical protein
VAVTDPAGTITHPVVSEAGSGAYSAVAQSVNAEGVWQYRWTAPGFVSEGQFTVRAANVESLVDLASVKAHLNISDQRADDELYGYIYAVADLARDFCGPFLPETHTEWWSGGVPTLVPTVQPVSAIASVTEYYGLSAFSLTEQELGNSLNAFAFSFDAQVGSISRRSMSGEAALFASGYKNVKVVYTAGGRPVPYSVRLGALEAIRHLWQMTQQSGRPKYGSAGYDDAPAVPQGYALPNRVMELWAPFRRFPGFA